MIYPVDSAIHLLNNRDQVYTRAVNPSCLQILRFDGRGMINDVIMAMAHDIICEKKLHKKDFVGIVTFDLIGLLPTNHIIAYMYITMAYRSL